VFTFYVDEVTHTRSEHNKDSYLLMFQFRI